MEIEIRECKIDDAEGIYILNKNSLGYDYPLEKTREKLYRISNKDGYKILVAVYEDDIVGYIEAHDYESLYQDSLVDIMALMVSKDCQGKGIGKKLVNEIELWAKENNYIGLRLVTRIDREQAHGFYERLGFKEMKIQKNFKKFF